MSVKSVEADEAPPVKRLDGGVTISGDIAFGGGMYCEVWVGQWMKGGGEKTEVEKVSLSPIAPISLIGLFVGGPENTSNAQATRGDT